MRKILLVEDDDDLRIDLAELLRDEGYEVVTAADGREALKKLHSSGELCLILLDLMMPVMDGWAFRAEMLRDPKNNAIKVFIISGAGQLDRHTSDLKAAGYIEKPIAFPRLLHLIEAEC